MKLEKLDSTLFDWLTWRNGHPLDLGIEICRKNYILNKQEVIKKYAIGYCNGENLVCRPKIGHKAVMFYKNDIHFWFHLKNDEFFEIFS